MQEKIITVGPVLSDAEYDAMTPEERERRQVIRVKAAPKAEAPVSNGYSTLGGMWPHYPVPHTMGPKLCGALLRAQSEIRAIGKSGENKFDHYRYATLEDYVEAARPALTRHGLSLVIGVLDVESLPDRPTKNQGVEHAVRVELQGILYHESGEYIETKCYGEGQDRGDKAVYKAITGGKKYLISNLLGISTSDDPENEQSAPEPRAAAPRAVQPAVYGPLPAPEIRAAASPQLKEEIRAALTDRQRANVAKVKMVEVLGEAKGTALFDEVRARFAPAGKTMPPAVVPSYVAALEEAVKTAGT